MYLFKQSNFIKEIKEGKQKIFAIMKLSIAFFVIATLQIMATGYTRTVLQGIVITGTVTDTDGSPLPGATITIKGGTQGTVTDANGVYTLQVPNEDATLLFSYIGFSSQEVTVGNRRTIHIALIEDAQRIDEVVVVGYGTQKKVTLTGAVSSIKGEEIVTTKNENVQNMLTGKIAGVRVVQNSSEPGRFDNNMDIRGYGAPLVIIDGVPRGTMQRLDSEDIESISVLKDASAAIYGLRAGNGVILITTKKGSQMGVSVNYTGNMTWQVPSNFPDMVDAAEWMELWNAQNMRSSIDFPYRTYSQEEIDAYRNGEKQSTNWKDAVFRHSAPQTYHNLNISGGNDAVRYFVSGGYQYQGSFLQTDAINYKKYNLRSNISANLNKNKSLTLDMNIAGTMDVRKGTPYNTNDIIYSTWIMRPMTPVYADEEHTIYASSHQADLKNPAALIDSDLVGECTYKGSYFQSSATMTWRVPFVKGLSLKGFYSFDKTVNDDKIFQRSYVTQNHLTGLITTWQMTDNKPYNVGRYYYDKQHQLWNWSASYNNSFLRNNVSGLLLFENTVNRGDNFRGERRVMLDVAEVFAGESENQSFTQDSNGSVFYDYAYQGLVGRLNYDFDSKYIVEFLFRYEASSRFSSEMRWAFFPSFMAAYRISEENFWKNSPLKFINNFKIRGSYGKMGDDSVQNYQFITGYDYPGSGGITYMPRGSIFDGSFVTSSQVKGIANRNLTWLELETINLGIDAEAWNGLVGVTAEIFQRDKNGELATRVESLPGIVGASLPQENLNSSRIRGFEIDLTHRNNFGEFTYQVKGNVSYTKHKYLHLERATEGNSYNNWRNNSNDRYSGIWWGYGADSRYTNWNQIWNSPVYIGNGTALGDYQYLDWNGDGMISGLDIYPLANNSNTPLINYGITMSAQWKGIDLTMLWQGTSSRYIAYNQSIIQSLWAGTGALTHTYDRWHPADPTANPYDPATTWVEGYHAWASNIPDLNSLFNMQNAAYIRLKNIEIGYSLPKKWLSKVNAENLRFYVSCYKLLTFTKLKYLDPEFPSTNTGYNYPLNKTYTLGLNLKF